MNLLEGYHSSHDSSIEPATLPDDVEDIKADENNATDGKDKSE